MTHLDHKLARRTLLKGAGLGLGAGDCRSIGHRHKGSRARASEGGQYLEQRILGEKGRRAAMDVSKAA